MPALLTRIVPSLVEAVRTVVEAGGLPAPPAVVEVVAAVLEEDPQAAAVSATTAMAARAVLGWTAP
jgi:hypothetical protein